MTRGPESECQESPLLTVHPAPLLQVSDMRLHVFHVLGRPEAVPCASTPSVQGTEVIE
ncbi:hypothetical protein MF271_01100 (plasmid) [Deinococcus sp. KNUC1210]|uniref:hypothetical protein n=1 Tax=Deinococcus sp. KNUC1210 TaxID=2917691 RepID=UPI001EF04F84|nr:hypothetical protein [Deinococcus sp. KNUC1210]ULH13958.1 hypothetical protein MF271_01100 [Deinococcus sp. KNUC1210]